MEKNSFSMNLLTLAAVIAGIAVSSFTVKVDTTIYMVFAGGCESEVGSYNQITTPRPHQSGTGRINWFKIIDQNNGIIDQIEFTTRFELFDSMYDAANLLSDELFDIGGNMDLKTDM